MSELKMIQKPGITHTQLVKYAGASGDFNPIHTVVPVGEKAGLDGVIAHGMLIMGMAGEALAEWFPRKDLRKFKVRFSKMTRPGEKLTIEGRATGEKWEDDEKRLTGEVSVKNEAGEQKLSGRFEVKI
ncbi:MaoC/PaaZ C-terminal domain-containing protein [Cytobacillus firmus]|uniref:MaoC/PaaZ C-terminal domain-containing protein n=1 Tax=Cytobacillus firmus TaxID=1399 RepID=UPI00077C6BCF|nr:MaoC/PaaZ C-terminal domain-containing protein [Cytobacillus firmus]MBG9544845.1 3-hydroxyacyl-ACP dehydratase [Cytobacillus firmus]MBG9550598.1 3-hydroxyacyl-ACP dehydratase [Cytobacillus firmus]MBG9554336.1 3-hydroxyacyl-ACP dehydratase [Cytobacillus firmus]MBG9558182.1 3-hydroxyacyl-ACP dehydratase [Cytobacillus firmus]MBG9574360.1 3-hydroxyacyl-ACP dehydratase [Cytobacillus firmus]